MQNKIALVTGAAKRVGACIVKNLHAEGCRVIVHYRGSKQDAEQLVAELNAQRADSAACLQADLSDMQAVSKLAEDAVAVWGGLDILVNNASGYYPTPFGTATVEQWDELFSSNVQAPFFLAQALAPALKASKGVIVSMADVHADRPMKNFPIYCMAKAAVVSMTKSLATALAPDVRVNAVAPGMILWPDENAPPESAREYILKRIALERFGEPQDVAEAIVFLLKQSYVTGQILPVDGGRSLLI
jgi:pteridine reductase